MNTLQNLHTHTIYCDGKDTPEQMIQYALKKGFGVVITSDCHDGSKLDCSFADARQILMECGFEERYILTSSGFQAVAI